MSISLAQSSIIAISTIMNCNIGDICENDHSVVDWLKRDSTPVIESVTEPEFNPLKEAQYLQVPDSYRLDVPFTVQAPFSNWILPYSEACEEASLAMVEYYIRGAALERETADYEIHQILGYEEDNGWGYDIGVDQVAQIAEDIYGRKTKRYVTADVTEYNIEHLLYAGYPIIVPTAGRVLGNPNYIGLGPPYHMVVIIGYDNDYFYAHDPGTQFGYAYPYKRSILMDAIHEWTGDRATILDGEKAMLVLE